MIGDAELTAAINSLSEAVEAVKEMAAIAAEFEDGEKNHDQVSTCA